MHGQAALDARRSKLDTPMARALPAATSSAIAAQVSSSGTSSSGQWIW